MPVMPTQPVLLDTDTVSAMMRRQRNVVQKANAYQEEHGRFALSCITRYEILKGLKAVEATRRIDGFELFCADSIVIPLTDDAIVWAAEVYAALRSRGEIITDADILIAASALVHRFGIATNNVRHFRRIPGLRIENWLE